MDRATDLPIAPVCLALALAAGAVIVSTPADPSQEEASPPEATHFPNGDPRQRPEFERIAARLYESEKGFFTRGKAEKTRRMRADETTSAVRRLDLSALLVDQLLREGQPVQAVEEVERLFAEVRGIPGVLDQVPYLLRLRGLAYLRLAEVENCVKRHNADCCLFPLERGGVHTLKHPAVQAKINYEAYLARHPDDLSVRWLLNIASMALGTHPAGVPAAYRIPSSAFASNYDIKRFPDIAPRLGIDTFNHCGGCIADDFDNDGLLDIVTSTIEPSGPLTYYRNAGDGTFQDRSRVSHLDDQLGGLNIVGGDYDNDGLSLDQLDVQANFKLLKSDRKYFHLYATLGLTRLDFEERIPLTGVFSDRAFGAAVGLGLEYGPPRYAFFVDFSFTFVDLRLIPGNTETWTIGNTITGFTYRF